MINKLGQTTLTMTNRAEIYFALYGPDLDPDEVTKVVGFEPTSITRRADLRSKDSTWKVSSGQIESDVIDVYDISAALVARLAPFSDKLALAKRRLNAQAVLEVVLWITTDDTIPIPAIGFDSVVLSFLVGVGATIDIDTYRNAP
jgi:hypothetical protein